MIHLDTSVFIDVFSGEKPLAPRLRELLDRGERVSFSTLVLFEWRRGPRMPEKIAAQEALFRSEGNGFAGWEQRLLSSNFFWHPWSTTPLKQDKRAKRDSFAAVQQFPETGSQRFFATEYVNEDRCVEMDHSKRVRRPPLLRAARISAISASASSWGREGMRAIIRSNSFNMWSRSSSVKRPVRAAYSWMASRTITL